MTERGQTTGPEDTWEGPAEAGEAMHGGPDRAQAANGPGAPAPGGAAPEAAGPAEGKIGSEDEVFEMARERFGLFGQDGGS